MISHELNNLMPERQVVPQFPLPQEPFQRPKQTESSRGGLVEFLWETIKIVVISLVIIVPVRYYLIQPFFVKGQSMEPNFHDKDYLIVDKLGYRLDKPKRGDVIVFEYPYDTSEHFIKRIVGLPGETVEVKENTVKIFNSRYPDGLLLDEKIYLPPANETRGAIRTELKSDEYFVMGDNRMHSSDSRAWGVLNKKFISGRAWIRLWPLNKIESVDRVTFPLP